jgi:Rrf2 family protein
MLLTKKSEYAMLALVLIAKKDTPQNTDELSAQLNISKSFLAKILQKLAKNGILESYKGFNGGFLLKKNQMI